MFFLQYEKLYMKSYRKKWRFKYSIAPLSLEKKKN